ncbi:MAG: SDR family oxidoreductase [Bacteroidales bacterium]
MNIVVTGASKGIGSATAVKMAEHHSNIIVITGRDKDGLAATARKSGGNIITYAMDLNEGQDAFTRFRSYLAERLGSVDILINNAGVLFNRSFNQLSENEVIEMTRVNFHAPFFLVRELLPLFRSGSHIVNISSMGGFQGSAKFSGLSVYSSTKAALACLTECLAVEMAPLGISVNCIAPGSADTEMLRKAFPGYKTSVTAEEMASFISDFALNRGKLFSGKIIPVSVTTP